MYFPRKSLKLGNKIYRLAKTLNWTFSWEKYTYSFLPSFASNAKTKPHQSARHSAKSKASTTLGNSSWKLISIEQTDELDKGDDEALEVTTLMGGAEAAVITFNSAGFTYTLEAGTMRSFFPASGNWFFDNNDFPQIGAVGYRYNFLRQ